MGSRCYDDTRLIGCGCEMGERGEGQAKDGGGKENAHPNHARHTSLLQRERGIKRMSRNGIIKLWRNETQDPHEKVGFSHAHGNEQKHQRRTKRHDNKTQGSTVTFA